MSLEEPEPVPFHPQHDVPTFFISLRKVHIEEEPNWLIAWASLTTFVPRGLTRPTAWQCTVRPKGNQCKASVIEHVGVLIAPQVRPATTIPIRLAPMLLLRLFPR